MAAATNSSTATVLTAIIRAGGDCQVGDIGWVQEVVHLDAVSGLSVDIHTAGQAVGGKVGWLPVSTVLASCTLSGVEGCSLETRRGHCRKRKQAAPGLSAHIQLLHKSY